MTLQEMIKLRSETMVKAENIVSVAESTNRPMTAQEDVQFESHMGTVKALDRQIKQKESTNTLTTIARANGGRILPGAPDGSRTSLLKMPATKNLSGAYFDDFHAFLKSRGTVIGQNLAEGADGFGGYKLPGFQAASYEGGSSTGTPVTPVIFDQNIVELAPAPVGVRQVATVIPTVADLKFGRKTAFGSVAIKAEGDGTGDNLFTDSDATLDNFTLSAFMIGGSHQVSWELLQDVQSFQNFAVNDLLLDIGVFEDTKFVLGTGTGQPQGLLGNTGAGVTGVLVGSDNYGSELIDATYDVMALLNPVYDNANTRWLMQKSTGLAIRKAQRKANLFDPVWVEAAGKHYLHGTEVVYSAAMPSIAAGNTPILYGDFKSGYVIGDRGGSGVSIKLLDQPKATEGLLIILGYRRTDGRVRRSEAIQAITLHT